MRKKTKRIFDCQNCMNCIPIGEGDHMCSAGEEDEAPVVIEEYMPTEDYGWCNGKHYEER